MTINIKKPVDELGASKQHEEPEDEGPEVEGHLGFSPLARLDVIEKKRDVER
ncbi:MAG TPA: hypothetical protein VG388_02685 [Solirubrobacteraceae bacterium]|jgi:hypothetical protein|nr:hypothetical protein [Solirubrobacteraceae bacterium]